MCLRKAIPQHQEADVHETKKDGQRWLELVHQRLVDIRQVNVIFNPALVAANTTVEQTVTVSGLKVDDIVISVIKPTLSAGLGVLQGRVSATDTLAIQFINSTASGINAGEETYSVVYIKNSKV